MQIDVAIQKLESEWNLVDLEGFFGNLRKNIFDRDAFERVKEILSEVEINESDTFNRRFVELTWFIPTFLHWQRAGWIQSGRDTQQLDRAIEYFEQRLTTILGLP